MTARSGPTRAAAAGLAVLLASSASLPAHAGTSAPGDGGTVLGEPVRSMQDIETSGDPRDTVEHFSPDDHVDRFTATDHVDRFDPSGHVEGIEQIDQVGEQTIISLQSDILFETNEWELPESAVEQIDDLISSVPQGEDVQVVGHTDSRPTGSSVGFDNQELSENRAQAVADVIAESRPDLTLEVEGMADEQPAVEEDDEDSETFAQNRRVEIVYGAG